MCVSCVAFKSFYSTFFEQKSSRVAKHALNIASAWSIFFIFYCMIFIHLLSLFSSFLLHEGNRTITCVHAAFPWITWHQKAWTETNEHESHVPGCIIKVILHHVSSQLPQFNTTSHFITIHSSLNMIIWLYKHYREVVQINVAYVF